MPAPPKRKRRIVPVLIVAVVVFLAAVAVVAIVITKATMPGDVTITGTLVLTDDDVYDGAGCHGQGGYRDIVEGAQVVVTDQASTTLALGTLGRGVYRDAQPRVCTFPFSVASVPDREFYGVEVAHRGRVQYPRAAVAQPLAIALGT